MMCAMAFRRWVLWLLFILIALISVACRNPFTPVLEPTPEGTYSVDPVFEDFYRQYGGVDRLGYAISTSYTQQGKKLQYLETVLMMFDPGENRIYFEDLGIHLNLQVYQELVPDTPISDGIMVGTFTIHPAFTPIFWELGPDMVGQPLTDPYIEFGKGRVVQHFSNLGFYFNLDDPSQTPHLLKYGLVACKPCQNSLALKPEMFLGILDEPLGDTTIYSVMGRHNIPISLSGTIIQDPAMTDAGETLIVFENLAMQEKDGKFRLRPIPVLLGYKTALIALVESPRLIFFEIRNGMGHNVLKEFDTFIQANGGYRNSGPPISELSQYDQQTGFYRQCFKFYCLDYYANEEIEKVRPVPLGRIYLESAGSIIGHQDSPPDGTSLPRNKITLQAWESWVNINSVTPQTISVLVILNDQPLVNAQLTLRVNLPGVEQPLVMQLQPTDQDGKTSITLEPIVAENSDLVPYEICLQLPDGTFECINDVFMIWGNP